MLIEFYPRVLKPFVREIPLPLPTIFRIPKHKNGSFASSLGAMEWPPSAHQSDYIEFELSRIRFPFDPESNVVTLPRQAYREVQSVGRVNSNE